MNILDYLNQNKNKKLRTITNVEALILAQSSYFNFERFKTEALHYPISIQKFLENTDVPAVDGYMLKKNYELMRLMSLSKRYHDLIIVDSDSTLNHEREIQFAAVTYRLNARTLFVAFRGTDSSVTGWKDDFNMTFEHDTKTQIKARAYLNKIQTRYPKMNLYVGGHSKGGNIAVYASAYADNPHRIKSVFDFDGPGFHETFLKSEAYLNIKPRVHKFIPQSSIIGLLLKSDEAYQIVSSKEYSIFQHDPYNWIIKNRDFMLAENLSDSSVYLQKTLTQWLGEVDGERRMQIVDAFFRILQDMEIEYFSDLKKSLSYSTVKYLLDGYSNLDESLRRDTFRFFGKFVQIWIQQFAEGVNPFKNINFEDLFSKDGES